MSNKFGIAISGKSGCGNTTVSRMLAQRLGFTMVNYTFRSMAEELGLSFEELRAKAEHDDSWDLKLDQHQLELARSANCVLGSRLAIWIYKDADLKIYLYASPETRAKRIQSREGGDSLVIAQQTAERDRKDQSRYRKIYGIDTEHYHHAALVINTDYFSPEDIVEMIVKAAEIRGLRGN